MARLQPVSRTVFHAPTKGRAYLTKKAAANAEAGALIQRKYPTEHEERDDLGVTCRGWHWTQDDRLRKLHERLARLLRRAL